MKKDEVPQDDANMLQGKTRELQYALDKEGNYTAVKSVGWQAKNEIMQNAWDDIHEQVAAAKAAVLNGEKSTLYYHMVRKLMDVHILSGYSKIWQWRIKRHLQPKHFAKLSDKILNKYVAALDMPSIAALNDIEYED